MLETFFLSILFMFYFQADLPCIFSCKILYFLLNLNNENSVGETFWFSPTEVETIIR